MISFSRNSVKTNFLISISSLSVIGLFVVSIFIGKYGLTIEEIYKIITHTSEDPMAIKRVLQVEAPEYYGCLGGDRLAMAAAFFKPCLKSSGFPDIIGVTSGASVGAAFSIVFLAGMCLLLL